MSQHNPAAPYPELTWTAVVVGWFLGVIIAISIGYAALILGFSIAASRFDFGPMRAAERRARETGAVLAEDARPIAEYGSAEVEPPADAPHRALNALTGEVPVVVVLEARRVDPVAVVVDAVGEASEGQRRRELQRDAERPDVEAGDRTPSRDVRVRVGGLADALLPRERVVVRKWLEATHPESDFDAVLGKAPLKVVDHMGGSGETDAGDNQPHEDEAEPGYGRGLPFEVLEH